MSILDQNDPEPTRSVLDQNDPDGPTTPVRPGGPPPLGRPVKPAAPKKDDPTWGEVGRGFVGNIGQGAKDFALTVRDVYRRPLVDNAYLMATGAMDTTDAVKELMKSPDKAWAALKAAGGVYAERYTTLDGFKRDLRDHPYQIITDIVTVATLPVPGAAGATLGGKVAQGTGAVVSKVAPSVSAAVSSAPGVAKYAAKALVAPTHVLNDAAGLVPKAARIAEGIKNPINAFIGKIAGGKESEMMNALANAKTIVPGSKPTAAQAVASRMPATQLAAADRTAQRWLSDEAAGAMNVQNDARLSHFDKIAEIPGKPNVPLDQRVGMMDDIIKQDNAKYYGASDAVVSKSNDRLFEILDLPLNDDILGRARRLAKQEEGKFGSGPYVPAHSVPDPYGQNLPPVQVPAQYPSYNGAELDFIKKAFDELAFDTRKRMDVGQATKAEIEAIRDARTKFLNWVDTDGGNPQYTAARNKAAENYKLRNQMDVARLLRSKLTNKPGGEDALKLQAQQFRAALDSPLNDALGNRNVRQATGEARYDSIRQLLGDDQYAALVRIADDLGRQALTDQYATMGSKHAGDIESLMSDALHVDPNNRFVKPFVNWKDRSLATEVSNALATPQGLEGLIVNRLAREREIGSLNRKVNAFVTPYRVMNRYPALYNVFAGPQQEQQPTR